MLHARSVLHCASLLAVIAAAGCDSGTSGGDHYLTPGLRAAVEELKSDVAAAPTDGSTIATRARVLADWADAYSMAGGEVGLEGPRIRLQSSLPPSGRAAINQSANLDRLVREFTLPEGEDFGAGLVERGASDAPIWGPAGSQLLLQTRTREGRINSVYLADIDTGELTLLSRSEPAADNEAYGVGTWLALAFGP